jgi:hypothetical protein
VQSPDFNNRQLKFSEANLSEETSYFRVSVLRGVRDRGNRSELQMKFDSTMLAYA